MTQKERQERSRQEILQAALEEFGSHPYEAVTMERICTGHGISKGMMYHYYSGKDELFLLCVSHVFQGLEAYLKEHSGELPADPAQAIRSYFLSRLSYFALRPKEQRIFESAMLRPPQHLREAIADLHASLDEHNRRFLFRTLSALELRPGLEPEFLSTYLERLERVFQSLLDQYRDDGALPDLPSFLNRGEQLLDLLLFGVFRQPH